MFVIRKCQSLASLSQRSLMFPSKAGAYLSEASFRDSTLGQAPGLIHQHYTGLERPARNQHSSLFCPFVSQEENKVLLIPHWAASSTNFCPKFQITKATSIFQFEIYFTRDYFNRTIVQALNLEIVLYVRRQWQACHVCHHQSPVVHTIKLNTTVEIYTGLE